MTLLLDASVWLSALDPQDRFHACSSDLVAAGPRERTLAALDLTVFEVANVAIRSWKSHADATYVAELVETAAGANFERVDGETAAYTIDVAEMHGLSAYDAAYVAVAKRRGWTLVSTDERDLLRPGLAVPPDAVPDPRA